MTRLYNVSPTIFAQGIGSHRFQGPQNYSLWKRTSKILKACYLCRFRPLQNILFTTTSSRTNADVVDT